MATRLTQVTTRGDGNIERKFVDRPADPTAFACIKTGEYTGDGTTGQAITGLGFTPKFVKIWRRETVSNSITRIYETTTEIIDDHADGMAIRQDDSVSGVPEVAANAIISLDADGFTVDDNGADSAPNKLNDVYNYMCLG